MRLSSISLGVVAREAADALQVLELTGQRLLDLGVPLAHFLLLVGQRAPDGLELDFFVVDQLELLVEDVGSFVEPPLLLAEVAASSIDLGLEVFAALEDFLLGGQFALLADRVGLELGVGENLVGEPARSSRETARSGTRWPARSTHPKAAPHNRSGKLLQVAARPDREPVDSEMNLSGGAGAKGYGRRQRLKREASRIATSGECVPVRKAISEGGSTP